LAWGCGLDSTGSGWGPVAGCCECGDEPSGSCASEWASYRIADAINATYCICLRRKYFVAWIMIGHKKCWNKEI
jgi:hypothetical protein